MSLVDSIATYVHEHAVVIVGRIAAAVLILALAWFLARLARRSVRKVIERSGGTSRAATLTPIVQALITVVLWGTGAVIALQQFGFDLTAVIAGAGVLGLAIGFGAQELVKDVISGFFLIFDGVVEADDFITTDTITGKVEEIGIRVTRIRSYDGKLWYVPNGKIQVVGNMNRQWVRAIVEVGLAYEQDVARGLKVMQEVGEQWAKERPDLALEVPEAQGVVGLNDSAVGVRLVGMVAPGEHWSVQREWRKRIKAAFDEQGVEIPFQRHVMYLRDERAEAS